MELFELCRKIQLQKEVVSRLYDVVKNIHFPVLADQLDRLTDIRTAPEAYEELKNYFGEDPDNLSLLACSLECAARDYEKYRQKHIPDEIYVDTMKCFTRFIGECYAETGRYAFDRGWWTYRQLSMTLFRIGALEYEWTRYENKPAIAVHIPSDADFRDASVEESLRQSVEFCKKYYPEYTGCRYTCDSWLLSPKLGALLDESSNIRKFQRRFDLISTNPDDREFIQWLFHVSAETDCRKLKEDTSLQRKVKKVLLEGDNIGSAYGVMR
ncbi:acyltransferase domain-containing protein [Marvinbryantia formatexigens]|nr:acyltransferase domain-containing protein [Marvinbryantia formatexigens]UWO23056.1 acyltransferase domain-containing protein [Marvinbryantia formatexigens DSM 14469]SDF97443.1 hypothetical protein SAMN05660368_01666 [Marvinbryantia formatexigens]